MTAGAGVEGIGKDIIQPCRPYEPGDHSAWLRGRLNRSMLIAAAAGGVVSVLPTLVVGFLAPALTGVAAVVAGWSAIVLFPVAFLVIHWATIGRRRWRAMELVVWAGRIAAARCLAATGITDPSDRPGAAAWLASTPSVDGEPPETTYWRTCLLLLMGDADEARAELARLPATADWEFDRATLADQLDAAEAREIYAGALDALVKSMSPSEERAVAAVEVGALRSHVAWTCGQDDVAPVLAAEPLVEGRAARTLLRHYWLLLGVMTAIVWAALWLVLSLLR